MALSRGPGPGRPRSRGLIGSWLFALVWLGICVSAALNMEAGDWGGRVMLLAFVAVGLVMLGQAVRETLRARRHAGATLVADPPRPAGGTTVRVALHLPHVDGGRVTLRLAEMRIDDSDSTTRTRVAWEQRREVQACADANGGALLQASFELPADAAAQESRRDGERVNWRIERLGADGEPELSFDLAVQAGPGRYVEPADRWAPRAAAASTQPAPAAAAPPAGASLHEDAAGIEWRFARRAWRWLGAAAGLAALVMLGLAWQLSAQEHDLKGAINRWAIASLLLAAALHVGSLRWRLQVGDDGVRVDRGSWMWPRARRLPMAALERLETELAYTVTTNGRSVEYHRVQARLAPGDACALTPGLATRAAAEAMAAALARSAADRGTRFAPGRSRSGAAPGATLSPSTRLLLAWLGWAAAVALLWLGIGG